MPLIIPSNSISAGGFAVDNSLRFNRPSSDTLTRTFGSSGNKKTFTLSAWYKRSEVGVEHRIFSTHNTGSPAGYASMHFHTSDDIILYNYNGTGFIDFLRTDRKFRDLSAWYHVVLAYDTTQGTSSNRVKLYINGVQETSFSTATYPSQNADLYFNDDVIHYVSGGDTANGSNPYSGYMSEVCLIDGQQLDPTSFGEFDEDSGIWKPIDVSGLTFGTNGFYLDFEDSGSLGADVSGNGNNFTVNNLTAIDQTTDTPTNNFCTMNPLYPDGTITFSEGNLKLTEGAAWRSAGGTMAVSQGKWYWEVSNVGNYAYIGFADIQLFNDGCSIRESFTTAAATTGKAHSVLNSDGRHYQVTSGGAQSSEYPAAATFPSFTNSIIGVALNLDDNNFTLYKDGTVMNPSGTPISITAGTYIPAVSIYGNNVSMNFGSPPYTISSSNTDANGYGNFEHSVPSGFLSLCTANISEVLG